MYSLHPGCPSSSPYSSPLLDRLPPLRSRNPPRRSPLPQSSSPRSPVPLRSPPPRRCCPHPPRRSPLRRSPPRQSFCLLVIDPTTLRLRLLLACACTLALRRRRFDLPSDDPRHRRPLDSLVSFPDFSGLENPPNP